MVGRGRPSRLSDNCKHHIEGCWEFLKEDGSSLSPKSVPVLGRPPIQIIVIALGFIGKKVPKGHYIHRKEGCIKHCVNPYHCTISPTKEGERAGRPSNNPKGNPHYERDFSLSPRRKKGQVRK